MFRKSLQNSSEGIRDFTIFWGRTPDPHCCHAPPNQYFWIHLWNGKYSGKSELLPPKRHPPLRLCRGSGWEAFNEMGWNNFIMELQCCDKLVGLSDQFAEDICTKTASLKFCFGSVSSILIPQGLKPEVLDQYCLSRDILICLFWSHLHIFLTN